MALYKEFMKATRQLDNFSKDDTVLWIRSDFKKNMHAKDEVCTYICMLREVVASLFGTQLLLCVSATVADWLYFQSYGLVIDIDI